MKNLLFILSIVAISFSCNAQPRGGLIHFKTDVERAKRNGSFIEDATILSDVNGRFTIRTFAELAAKLNIQNASAVDSIYSSNDTLYVVYFDAPRLAYKASGLNGIYSASNNNKNSAVSRIYYPSSGAQSLTLQTASGLGKVEFNTLSNTPLALTANSGSGYLSFGYANASNNCFHAFSSSGQLWTLGSASGYFMLRHNTSARIPFKVELPTGGIAFNLLLKANGDISMSNYQGNYPANALARIPSTGLTNVMFTDAAGVLQLSSLSTLKDSLYVDGSATNEIQGIDNVLSQNESLTNHRNINQENFILNFNNKSSEGEGVNFWSKKPDNTGLSHIGIGTSSNGYSDIKWYSDGSTIAMSIDAEGNINASPDLVNGNYWYMPLKQGYGYWDNNAHDFKIGINKGIPAEALDVIGNGVISGTLSVQEIAVNNPAPTETLDVIGTGSISSTLTIGGLVIPVGNAPTNSSDPGVMGQIAWDGQYIYVCISTNTWVRSPLTSW